MTPTGMTKIVITNTRNVVPTIIGRMPVVFMSNKSVGIVETKRQEKLLQPLIKMFSKITARMPTISNVASPVSPVKKNDQKSNFSARKLRVVRVVSLEDSGRYWLGVTVFILDPPRKKTSNTQHRTSNIQCCRNATHPEKWMLVVRCWLFDVPNFSSLALQFIFETMDDKVAEHVRDECGGKQQCAEHEKNPVMRPARDDFAHFGGDGGGDAARRIKDAPRNHARGTNHQHNHRFTDGAAKAQHGRSENSGQRGR